ncbi:MAG: hypothetical protein ACE5I2_06430, partial [Anaerolineae bacterium]
MLLFIRVFERKGVHAGMTGITAMVCPQCGTECVPAEIVGDVILTSIPSLLCPSAPRLPCVLAPALPLSP